MENPNLYTFFNKSLQLIGEEPVVGVEVDPTNLISSNLVGDYKMSNGLMQSGSFISGSSGWKIAANGDVEFNDGNFRGDITGATGTFTGTVSVGSLNIPDTTTANSFHVDTTGNAWWGAVAIGASTAKVLNTGAATFSNITITGGSVATSTLSGTIAQTNLNLADRGWTQTCVFSVTDLDTVAWGVGTFTSADGTVYNISAGNTGNMVAKTFVYLDIAVSTTAYQTTTTATTAVGAGKVLIAVAQNGDSTATYSLTETSMVTGDMILANTIVANKMSVTTLSSIVANLGTITAGNITLDTSGYIRGGATDYLTGTGFFQGYSGGVYKFSVGNPATSYFSWDGNYTIINANSSPMDSYNETNRNSSNSLYNGDATKVGQSFTGNGKTLEQVFFYVKKTGAPTGNIVAKIYAHSGTYGTTSLPTGVAIYTSENVSATSVTSDYTLIGFRFTTTGILTLGTHYVVTVEYSGGDSSNYITIGVDSSSPTHSGNWVLYIDGSWGYDAKDTIFYVWDTSRSYVHWDSSSIAIKWPHQYRPLVGTVDGLDVPNLFPSTDWDIGGENTNTLSGNWYVGDFLGASTGGLQNLGDATYYFNDISYKTLTDRGCLGWFDDGVELQNGTVVSDLEAISQIKKHPTEMTIYGSPKLDYKTFPKVCYKKADDGGKELPRDEKDNPYNIDKTGKKIYSQDGIEMTSMFSIMIGAIKELNNKIEQLNKQLKTKNE